MSSLEKELLLPAIKTAKSSQRGYPRAQKRNWSATMNQMHTVSESRTIESPTSVWPGLVQAALIAVLIVFVYHRILAGLAGQWLHDPNYSYGFLVPLFSAWVLWRDRKRLAIEDGEPSWVGLVIIGAALGQLVLGVVGAENFLSRTSLLFLVAGFIIHFRGWKLFRAVLFPWSVLFLMIPLPAIIFNELALPLQFQASRLASGMLALLQVPVLREGNVIQLPSLTLDVAEACSGLRSLAALITLAVIYGYVAEQSRSKRVLLILAAVPIAVVSNGVRIMGSGILGEYWSPERAEGFFHLFSGLLIFLLSFGLLALAHLVMARFGPHPRRRQP